MHRTTLTYVRTKLVDDEPAIARIKEIIDDATKTGCPQIHDILRREGLVVNKKRTERIYYRVMGLSLRRRRRRSKAKHERGARVEATQPNERWAVDFVHDSLWTGRKIRSLTVIDVFTKECLAIAVDTSLTGRQVVSILTKIAEVRGFPKYIMADNGSEFRGRAMDKWAYDTGVTLDFSRPGKPTDNCFIESFNSRYREECLNCNYFDTMTEAKMVIEKWRIRYNEFRPHRSLKGKTPDEFRREYQSMAREVYTN